MNKIFLTWFGCGYSPKAPGTVGSLGSLPLCWYLNQHSELPLRVVFTIGFTAIAILASAQDQAKGGKLDPSYIVIDEVAGMLISTLMAPSFNALIIAFIAFRVFDIIKPFPASWFDNKSKTSPTAFKRGFHIVMDDVIAGIYSLIVIILLQGVL